MVAEELVPRARRLLGCGLALRRARVRVGGGHPPAGFLPDGPVYFEHELVVVLARLVRSGKSGVPEVDEEALPRTRRAGDE